MYDLAIIGAGAAGLSCFKKATQLKLKTVLIEKSRATFGGTCLNKGCIPTKLFLKLSQKNKDWPQLIEEKNKVVEKIKSPLLKELQKRGQILWGEAFFLDKNTLKVDTRKITARNIVIATGSLPQSIFSSYKQAIFAEELFNEFLKGDNFIILGAGSVGVEFSSLLNNLGKRVLLWEKEKRILPLFDSYLAERLRVILERRGIKIETAKNNLPDNLGDFDRVILATGRKPNLDNLGIEKIGISLTSQGWIEVDKTMKTNIDSIYACGDINGKKNLAYVAEYQGGICVEAILGRRIEREVIFADCVFSLPQLAQVGILEDEAKEKNLKYRVIKKNFFAFSSPYVYHDWDGFMEVLIDNRDRIIGAGIISNLAAELINIFSLIISHKFTIKDLKNNIFVHPTISEIIPLLLSG